MRRLAWWTLVAVALQATFAGVATTSLFFHPIVASAQRVFGGSVGVESVLFDVRTYESYGRDIWDGLVPYIQIVIEYPIGALPLFLVPAAAPAGVLPFRLGFALEMMAFQAATLAFLVARVSVREGERQARSRLVWSTALLAALGPLPIARYDLAPAFLAFAATCVWSQRGPLAGLLAGLGTMVKLFPGVVVVPLAVREGLGSWRALLSCVVTVIGMLALWHITGDIPTALRYHTERGLEIESVAASGLMLIGKIAGWKMDRTFDHSSEVLHAPAAETLALIGPWAQITLVGLAAARARRGDVFRSAGAAILGFVLGGKVFSPQYLLWVLPFVLAVAGRTGSWSRRLTLLACGLTFLVYPWSFIGLTLFHPLALALLAARNLTLIALYLTLLYGPEDEARP